MNVIAIFGECTFAIVLESIQWIDPTDTLLPSLSSATKLLKPFSQHKYLIQSYIHSIGINDAGAVEIEP